MRRLGDLDIGGSLQTLTKVYNYFQFTAWNEKSSCPGKCETVRENIYIKK